MSSNPEKTSYKDSISRQREHDQKRYHHRSPREVDDREAKRSRFVEDVTEQHEEQKRLDLIKEELMKKEEELTERMKKLKKREERLERSKERLENREEELEKREKKLEKREKDVRDDAKWLDKEESNLKEKKKELKEEREEFEEEKRKWANHRAKYQCFSISRNNGKTWDVVMDPRTIMSSKRSQIGVVVSLPIYKQSFGAKNVSEHQILYGPYVGLVRSLIHSDPLKTGHLYTFVLDDKRIDKMRKCKKENAGCEEQALELMNTDPSGTDQNPSKPEMPDYGRMFYHTTCTQLLEHRTPSDMKIIEGEYPKWEIKFNFGDVQDAGSDLIFHHFVFNKVRINKRFYEEIKSYLISKRYHPEDEVIATAQIKIDPYCEQLFELDHNASLFVVESITRIYNKTMPDTINQMFEPQVRQSRGNANIRGRLRGRLSFPHSS